MLGFAKLHKWVASGGGGYIWSLHRLDTGIYRAI